MNFCRFRLSKMSRNSIGGSRLVVIDADAWDTLNSAVSRPFDVPSSGRIAVKIINHLGDEAMKVFRVE